MYEQHKYLKHRAGSWETPWVFYVNATGEPGRGDVVLELPGTLPEASAEKVRKALESAYQIGKVHFADKVSSVVQSIRAGAE